MLLVVWWVWSGSLGVAAGAMLASKPVLSLRISVLNRIGIMIGIILTKSENRSQVWA